MREHNRFYVDLYPYGRPCVDAGETCAAYVESKEEQVRVAKLQRSLIDFIDEKAFAWSGR